MSSHHYEIFFVDQGEIDDLGEFSRFYDTGAGWYWWGWTGQRGLWDGDPQGPFGNKEAALADIQEQED